MPHTALLTQPHSLCKDLHSGTPPKYLWWVQWHGDSLGSYGRQQMGLQLLQPHGSIPAPHIIGLCMVQTLGTSNDTPKGTICHKPDLSVCEGAGGDGGLGEPP